MAIVYLGLGSNVGDRGANIQAALVELEKREVSILQTSSLYESEPVGYLDQPWFLNLVLRAETSADEQDLLKTIQMVELVLGRQRTVRFGPRTLDIDILFYGQKVVNIPGLEIPHPRLVERKFVLMPMVEIAPEFLHPVSGKSMKELLKICPDQSQIKIRS